MKKGLIIYIILALLIVLSSVGMAVPGIIVTLDPLSKSTQSGTIVDYEVIIINEDGILNESGNCIDSCWNKTILSLSMTSTQEGWSYDIEPLLTNSIPPGAGNRLTTILHITPPPGATTGLYNHIIDVRADSTEFDPTTGISGISYSDLSLEDNDYEEFITIIEGTEIAPIPEFPTVTLPIISVLGLMFLMYRRK